ncbi:hypothetical protein HYALB_00009734 [Hymenoscyphus albidus]|uniref:Uncharacterized protein n=1 Tax=Hymenoscyphus albidus TaxID=595503 RepID=A0A9N9LKI1_9HELO|nr:hypothetical protein HYALB_00009734 [Hymenoscyphus albidus]
MNFLTTTNFLLAFLFRLSLTQPINNEVTNPLLPSREVNQSSTHDTTHVNPLNVTERVVVAAGAASVALAAGSSRHLQQDHLGTLQQQAPNTVSEPLS